MEAGKVYNEPSVVGNDSGLVILRGPDGVAVSMTPQAASETGKRLLDNAAEALGKSMLDDDRRRRGLGSDVT